MDFDTHARIILKFIVSKQSVSIWKVLNSFRTWYDGELFQKE